MIPEEVIKKIKDELNRNALELTEELRKQSPKEWTEQGKPLILDLVTKSKDYLVFEDIGYGYNIVYLPKTKECFISYQLIFFEVNEKKYVYLPSSWGTNTGVYVKEG